MSEKSPASQERASANNGKRRLLEAALRLTARGGTVSSLGIRELAREAGLNHNTFYRHFRDTDDLVVAAAEEIARLLKLGLKEIRHGAIRHADATRGSAEYFFDFVKQHPEVFIVGLREIHGASPAMRDALRQAIDEIAIEIAQDLRAPRLAPTLDQETLVQITSTIAYYMFYRSLDYIERPEQREKFIEQIVKFTRMLFFGAAALRDTESPQISPTGTV